jgi:hypothetical protein
MGSMLLISSKTTPERNVYGGFALLFLPAVRGCCLFSSGIVCWDRKSLLRPRWLCRTWYTYLANRKTYFSYCSRRMRDAVLVIISYKKRVIFRTYLVLIS